MKSQHTTVCITKYHNDRHWYYIKCTEEFLLVHKYLYICNKNLSETQFYEYRNLYILLFEII